MRRDRPSLAGSFSISASLLLSLLLIQDGLNRALTLVIPLFLYRLSSDSELRVCSNNSVEHAEERVYLRVS